MTERFNIPPGWPVPTGWTPPQGWEPDPAWPPAPAGWQFWVEDGATPALGTRPEPATGTRLVILGTVGAVLLVVLAGAVVLFLHNRGNNVASKTSTVFAEVPDEAWTTSPRSEPTVLPAGAVECGVSAEGTYRGAAKGTDSTSCPFVENVRDAFNNAGGQVPTVVEAYSPVTGKHYQMSCAMEQVITCRGGVNAVVYVYEKGTTPRVSGGAAPASIDPLLFTPLGGHGRAMNLQPDGTGTLEFASGASNSDKWNVRWTQQSDGLFEIKVVSQISQYGDGTSTHVGSQWLARFQQERGFTVLRMVKPGESFDDPAEPGFSMCTAEAKLQSVCGA